MNSRDNPGPLMPDAPKNKLLFEDESPPPQDNAPATSGQVGQKSKKRGKLRRETEQPRPFERLRHDNDGGRPNGEAAPQSAETAEAPPTPGAATAAPDGGRRPSAEATAGDATPKPDKKAVREGKKLNKSKLRMEKTGDKLDAARDKLAAQKPPKKPGVIKNAGRTVKAEAWMAVHGKVYQAEHENVGIKAAHRTELAGEGAVRGVSRFVKHRVRTRPTQQVRKWEHKDIKARADHAFRTMARDNPEIKINAVSRFMQKRKIRRQYQKQARDAAKTTGTLAKRAVEAVRKIGGAVVRSVEQLTLKKKIAALQAEIDADEKHKQSAASFLRTVKRYTEIDELTPAIVNDLVEKIVVHQAQGVGKSKTQQLDIYYNFVGVLEMPDVVAVPNSIMIDTRQGVAVEYITRKAG